MENEGLESVNKSERPASEVTNVSMSTVLSRIEAEIRALADQSRAFQEEAGALMTPDRSASAQTVTAIQSLDALTQKLDCLSTYLEQISAQAPEGWLLDIQAAISTIALEELKHKLSGDETEWSDAAKASNGCEFF